MRFDPHTARVRHLTASPPNWLGSVGYVVDDPDGHVYVLCALDDHDDALEYIRSALHLRYGLDDEAIDALFEHVD